MDFPIKHGDFPVRYVAMWLFTKDLLNLHDPGGVFHSLLHCLVPWDDSPTSPFRWG